MTTDFKNKWQECLSLIKDNIGESRFNTWFTCAKPVAFTGEKLTLQLPSMFYYQKYEDDFYGILTSALRRIFGHNINLEYEIRVVKNDNQSKVNIESPQKSPVIKNKLAASYQKEPVEKRQGNFDPQLNYNLNFENYC